MTRGRLRPCRPSAAALGVLLLVASGLALAAGTGATWLYVISVAMVSAFVVGLGLSIHGAARARVLALTPPAVAIAGEAVPVLVEVQSVRAVAVRLCHEGMVVSRWWQPGGRHGGEVEAVLPARGVLRCLEVRLRCGAPFGLWPWERRGVLWQLERPLVVGPRPEPGAVAPVAPTELEGEDDANLSTERAEAGSLRSVRTWSDGDPIGWVHWPSSLRTGALLVREWEPPTRPEAEVRIPRLTDPVAAESAARRAAGAVDIALASGIGVHLVVPATSGTERQRVRDRYAAAAVLGAAALPPAPVGPTTEAPAPLVESRPRPRALVLAAVALGSGAALGSLGWPPGPTLISFVGLPLATYIAWRTRNGRSSVAVLVSTMAVVLVLLRFAASMGLVSAGGLSSVRDPLAELLLAIVVVHLADARERRNLRFALASSAVLLFYAGALRVDPMFARWVLAWLVVAALALVALHRSELADLGALRRATSPAVGRWRVVGRAGVVALVGTLATLAVLSIVPVPEGPVRLLTPTRLPVRSPITRPGALVPAIGGGSDQGGPSSGPEGGPATNGLFGYTAFAPSFDTSSRGRPDNGVVMRVRAPAADFWRAQTFERWDGRTWFTSPEIGTFVRGPAATISGFDGDTKVTAEGDQFVQTFFLARDMPNLVFGAHRPVELFLDAGVWVRPDGALRADTTLSAGTIYTVVSERVPVTEADLRIQGAPGRGPFGPAWIDPEMERYLQLPPTTTARVRALASQITDAVPNVYDKVRAIEAWLDANTEYDLAAPVPPAGADAVDHFLFESRRGFCEQIASALTVMLRAVGVPARVAAGYTPGTRDPFAGVYVVRGRDAHAWTEVAFPLTGWQTFDPTASVPLAGDTLDRGTLGGPIAAALGEVSVGVLRYLALLLPVAGIALLVRRVLRRRRRTRSSPTWVAQARFLRLVEREGIEVGPADTNVGLARRLAERRPDAADAGCVAAAALDASAFGRADPAEADAAVAALAAQLVRQPAPA